MSSTIKNRKVVRQVFATAVLAITGGALVAAPASAATTPNTNVYVAAPTWGGFCTGRGNAVSWVYYWNTTTARTGSDYGDDLVWVPVRTGVNNAVNITVKCRTSGGVSANINIVPTRRGQTFWARVDGSSTHN